MRRWARIIVGFLFLIIGFIGLFLPILQGILCLLIGLGILATEFEWANRLNVKAVALYERMKEKMKLKRNKGSDKPS